MAHIRTTIDSEGRNRKSVCGDKDRSHTVRTNGWKSGIEITANYNPTTGKDEFFIYATTGSKGLKKGGSAYGQGNNAKRKFLIAVVTDFPESIRADGLEVTLCDYTGRRDKLNIGGDFDRIANIAGQAKLDYLDSINKG